ncbi:MAG: protein-glutamate O-methyltransferase CheR [bacterium]|nr:protein-glutamate O-methyltransferase CheR [bacterium]
MASTLAPPRTEAPGERISDREFNAIRELVYARFGINLGEHKKSLVVGRLQKVLMQRGFRTFQQYYDWLKNDASGSGLEELANRITTNHTFFNREPAHFEFFAETLLPQLVARRRAENRRELRLWCAGCSSGEEPYTLMMLMREHLGAEVANWKTILLATDLSATVLRKAIMGVYDTDRVSQLPVNLRRRWFVPQGEGSVRVHDDIRGAVVFRRHNLMSASFPFRHQFDAVFCRNVMIYFDQQTRLELVGKFHRHTAPGGYLFIGHSETLGRDETPYEYVMPALYRKRPLG